MRYVALAALPLALSACAEGPDDRRSLRASLADWIAPASYTPNGGAAPPQAGTSQQQTEVVQRAYESDAARLQAGAQPISVSQVTIYGGQVNVPTGGGLSLANEWRSAGGVVTATVAECESVAVNVPRADKPGAATIYLTRINGIIFASRFASTGCQAPASAQSYPGYGQFPLQVQDRIMGATIRISPWGAMPAYPASVGVR